MLGMDGFETTRQDPPLAQAAADAGPDNLFNRRVCLNHTTAKAIEFLLKDTQSHDLYEAA